VWSLPLFVGTQIESKTALSPDMFATTWLRAAWVHEFAQRRSIEASFIVAPGYDFVIDGARAPGDAIRESTGAKLGVNSTTSF
jgi:uncharacterized protein with beta-barrel porin domain